MTRVQVNTMPFHPVNVSGKKFPFMKILRGGARSPSANKHASAANRGDRRDDTKSPIHSLQEGVHSGTIDLALRSIAERAAPSRLVCHPTGPVRVKPPRLSDVRFGICLVCLGALRELQLPHRCAVSICRSHGKILTPEDCAGFDSLSSQGRSSRDHRRSRTCPIDGWRIRGDPITWFRCRGFAGESAVG